MSASSTCEIVKGCSDTSPFLKDMLHNVVKIDSVVTKRLQFEKRKLFVTEGWSFKSASWELGLDVCISSKVCIFTALIEPVGAFHCVVGL